MTDLKQLPAPDENQPRLFLGIRSVSFAKPSATSFSPVYRIDGDFRLGLLLTADHARRDVPAEYGNLGLDESEFDRHIAYDIGVEALTRELALRLHAPAVLGGFSRLLIDPNRGEDDPTLIMQLSDGAVISGNYPMSAGEREDRLTRFYRPYHDAVAEMSARVAAESGQAPFIVSIHSFTPRWKGKARPWQVGLLWTGTTAPLPRCCRCCAPSRASRSATTNPMTARCAATPCIAMPRPRVLRMC